MPALLAFLLGLSSCAFFADTRASEPNAEADAQGADAQATASGEKGRPHPQAATAWHTRVLIATTAQPPGPKLAACKAELDAVAADATDQGAMIAAAERLTRTVGKDLRLYHFCFYQMAVALDERLTARAPLFDELAPRFAEGMRGLWILAGALDRAAGGTRYFDYVKQRYVGLSKELFGRELEPVAPPMQALAPAH